MSYYGTKLYEECKAWHKKHLTTIKSKAFDSPRGEWYCYASLYDGYIYAVGDEQGNYAGGDLASIQGSGVAGIKGVIERWGQHKVGSMERDLYDKIKDTPIISVALYNRMCEERLQWPRDCYTAWWYYDKIKEDK